MNANEQVFDFTLGQWAGQFQNYESQPRVEKLALIERMRKPENLFLIPRQAHIGRKLYGLCVLRLAHFGHRWFGCRPYQIFLSNRLPGLRRLDGSKRCFRSSILRRFSLPSMSSRNSVLSFPMPCSAETEPPQSTT